MRERVDVSRFVLGLALGAGLFASAGLAGCGEHGGEKAAVASTVVKPIPVTVADVKQQEVERTVEVVGSLRAWEQVTVGSKREGRVVKVFHDLGDVVKPGELLVTMDAVDADLSVAQSERRLQADLAQLGLKELPKGEFDPSSVPAVVRSKVALERARQNFARDRSLVSRGAGAKQDFQNSENDVQAAEAALADSILAVHSTLASAMASRAALDLSIQARKDMEIHAPVPSKHGDSLHESSTYSVSKRSVSEGQFLKVGDPVLELVIENPLRLWTSVPERFTSDIKLGQEVRIHVPAFPETPFQGKVARINPTIDSVSRTFQVETIIRNDEGKLRPGGFAKASIVVDTRFKATMVPLESVVSYAGVTKLFVLDGDKVHSVPVEPGMETNGWVEIVGALDPKSKVVTTGQTQLAEGTLVVVRQPEPGEAPRSRSSK
jgi:membrane fusion protein (multidrug efflux system)